MGYTNTEVRVDKQIKMCATCRYWCGKRDFDGIGCYTYDTQDDYGKCGQVGWKGFSGSQVSATMQCMDYEPQN